MAQDLRRVLEDRPILARRASTIERLRRWCRRNPAPAALSACVATLLLAVWVGSIVVAARFRGLAEQEANARAGADHARRAVEATLAELYPNNALAASRSGDDAEAALWFANAAVLTPEGGEQSLRNLNRAMLWARNVPAPVAAVAAPGVTGI